jgi:hypothetical protein
MRVLRLLRRKCSFRLGIGGIRTNSSRYAAVLIVFLTFGNSGQ